MGIKQKTCKECKEKFTPTRQLQPTCTKYKCMVDYADKHLSKKVKEKKKENNKAKVEFNWNDKSWLKKTAQDDINKYSRLRDQYENGIRCCTCPKKDGKMDGGHYLPTSGYSSIRYNTNQIHQQCVNCNRYNSGRRTEYTAFMIEKYGKEYVDKLNDTKDVLRGYSVAYYQKLIPIVRKKIKKMEKNLSIQK